MFNTDDRGQVGIGTLIVFIAMVLVAAIAAGVLINTAGLLQAQAQQTGEETTAEVSDLVTISEVVGSDSNSNSTIDELNVSMRLASGSDPINMSRASYTISSPRGEAGVINGNEDSSSSPVSYDQKQGFDDQSSDEYIPTEQKDVIIATIDLTDTDAISPLNESERTKLVVQSPAGGQSFKEFQAPRNINQDASYILS